jgi:hypothetical protein
VKDVPCQENASVSRFQGCIFLVFQNIRINSDRPFQEPFPELSREHLSSDRKIREISGACDCGTQLRWELRASSSLLFWKSIIRMEVACYRAFLCLCYLRMAVT